MLLLIRNFEKISICSWICPSQYRGKRSIQVLGNIAIKPHKLCAPSVEINKEIPKNARYFRRGAHKAKELPEVFHFGLLHRKCTVKTITNMRFWESIIENGWFRGWPRRTRGTSGARSRWQNSSFCTCRQLHKQLRWEPTIKCRLSCHLVWTWQRMLSQIGNQRGPAFSTHARNWLFNSRFLKVWSLGSLGSIQEQNFVF